MTAPLSDLEPDIAALLEADGVALRPGPRERIPDETLNTLREAILSGVWITVDHRARATGLLSRKARLGPLAMLLGDVRAVRPGAIETNEQERWVIFLRTLDLSRFGTAPLIA